jgi:ubiquinone/menaquinone biosynthesis C-methylase UbiE
MRSALFFTILIIAAGCASHPKMDRKDIAETFQPILDFMEYKPGMSFADVGAGSGEMTVSMATLMSNSSIYIQDIDTAILNTANIEKFIQQYSRQSDSDLKSKNNFHLTIGDTQQTNLPDAVFDRIYTNATAHNFIAFDALMTDIKKKLKPDGMLYLRDSFKNHNGEKDRCGDPSCARVLLDIDDFLAAMTKNGFVLMKRNENMSGYPVFGFKSAGE